MKIFGFILACVVVCSCSQDKGQYKKFDNMLRGMQENKENEKTDGGGKRQIDYYIGEPQDNTTPEQFKKAEEIEQLEKNNPDTRDKNFQDAINEAE